MRPRPTYQVAGCRQPFDRLLLVINEDSVLEGAMDTLREAAQRIRATQNLMHARGMTEEVNYRELLTRLSNKALAMTEAACVGCSTGTMRTFRERPFF
jgi:hypothetical protein